MPATERETPGRKPLTSREITLQFSLKKLLFPALVVGALVLAVVVVLWRPWPRSAVVSAPKIENSIAVISFENQTGDASFDYLQKAIPDLLITSQERRGGLYVATWERMLEKAIMLPRPCSAMRRAYRPEHPERALQVEAHDAVELGVADLQHGLTDIDAWRADQHVARRRVRAFAFRLNAGSAASCASSRAHSAGA